MTSSLCIRIMAFKNLGLRVIRSNNAIIKIVEKLCILLHVVCATASLRPSPAAHAVICAATSLHSSAAALAVVHV